MLLLLRLLLPRRRRRKRRRKRRSLPREKRSPLKACEELISSVFKKRKRTESKCYNLLSTPSFFTLP
jgi:hypothetical protein